MNMKKIFLCALIFTVVLSFGFAEDNAKDEYFPTAIGFNSHASMGGAQSMGLTYQHWFKNDLGYQSYYLCINNREKDLHPYLRGVELVFLAQIFMLIQEIFLQQQRNLQF